MNSEISNILKLSPVTVVKTEKPIDDKQLAATRESTGAADPVSPVSRSESSIAVSTLGQDEGKKAEPKPSLDVVKEAVDQGNSLFQAAKRNLEIKVDDATKELVVKVVDSETGEVVRQIPSEEMLTFVRRMQELDGLNGSVLQDRA